MAGLALGNHRFLCLLTTRGEAGKMFHMSAELDDASTAAEELNLLTKLEGISVLTIQVDSRPGSWSPGSRPARRVCVHAMLCIGDLPPKLFCYVMLYIYTYICTDCAKWQERISGTVRLPRSLFCQGSVSGGTWCSSVVMFATPWLGSARFFAGRWGWGF